MKVFCIVRIPEGLDRIVKKVKVSILDKNFSPPLFCTIFSHFACKVLSYKRDCLHGRRKYFFSLFTSPFPFSLISIFITFLSEIEFRSLWRRFPTQLDPLFMPRSHFTSKEKKICKNKSPSVIGRVAFHKLWNPCLKKGNPSKQVFAFVVDREIENRSKHRSLHSTAPGKVATHRVYGLFNQQLGYCSKESEKFFAFPTFIDTHPPFDISLVGANKTGGSLRKWLFLHSTLPVPFHQHWPLRSGLTWSAINTEGVLAWVCSGPPSLLSGQSTSVTSSRVRCGNAEV